METWDPSASEGESESIADIYLLKARTPRALAIARGLEERGARVMNSAAATALLQDRTAMAGRALQAGLPFAATRTFATLAQLASRHGGGAAVHRPLVVKSRHSRRRDLVARVESAHELRELASAWPEEPVVAQEFAPNSGWDYKLWVIGDRMFAALRRSELAPQGHGPARFLAPDSLPSDWQAAVRRVGEVFALDVYGVDIVDLGDGTPLIVDINAFPGVRGQPDAPQALAALIRHRVNGPPIEG